MTNQTTAPVAPTHNFGWLPDPPDYRDYKLEDHHPDIVMLARADTAPFFVDLSSNCLSVEDQKSEGSCTGFSGKALGETTMKINGLTQFKGSAADQYYWNRVNSGIPTSQDGGAYIRAAVQTLANQGLAHDALDPYVDGGFAKAPSPMAISDAQKYKALKYVSVPVNVASIKAVLASGYPVIIGFSVPASFMSTGSDGMVPPAAGNIIGGHAVLLVGYNDANNRFKFRNSWSTSWGDHGYGYMDYNYLMSLGSDFWMVSLMSGDGPTPVPPTPTPTPTPTPVPPSPTPINPFQRDGAVDGKNVEANPSYWGGKFINVGNLYGMDARGDLSLPASCKLVRMAITVTGNVYVHDGLSNSYTIIQDQTVNADIVLDDKGACWFSSASSGKIVSIKLVAYWP